MKRGEPRFVWPKQLPELTDEQEAIRDDFFGVWLEALPQKYGVVETFNHQYPLKFLSSRQHYRTLDIGAGHGEHLEYEDLSNQEYVACELREDLARKIENKFPGVSTITSDIQQGLDFPDGHFDRILAIHVLEHLPDLPRALDEIQRLLATDGEFSVLIPCDPGFAYTIARNISARRIFEKRYGQSYDWFVACEHINSPREIMSELDKRFTTSHRSFFPLVVPSLNMNLIVGLSLRKR